MDRRKSIKALLVGTVSTAVIIDACKTSDKKLVDISTPPVLDEADRMDEEKIINKTLREAVFF